MRLTLRTLLAYLDNILDPASMQAMTQKLEESPAAAELIHRIRDVTKKVRLTAPAVDGKGLGLDPNTVAEYLDHTLPAERTPDFEMVCVESDAHLAEVAACHEILSLVLVKPAEIDPASRQKMYDVINEKAPAKTPSGVILATPAAETRPTATPVASAVAATAAHATHEAKKQQEVPDYLRDSQALSAAQARRGWQLMAVAALVLLLVGGLAALAILPVDGVPGFLQPISRVFHPGAPVAQNESTDDADVVKPNTAPADPEATAVKPLPTATADAAGGLRQPDSVVTTPGVDPAKTPSAGVSGAGAGVGEFRQPDSVVSPSADVASTPATTIPPATVPPATIPPGATVTTPMPNPPGDPASPGANVVGTTVAGTPPAATVPAAPGTTVTVPSLTAPSPIGPDAPPTVPVTPPAVGAPLNVESVARISSPVSQVVLRFDVETNAWVRLPAREQLFVGDRLLTLPDYRSQIALANGVTIDMLGGTLVELTTLDADRTPGLLLLRGRLIAYTVGGAKAAVRLDNAQPPTTFSLATAELGFEFVPQRAPGDDPGVPQPWLVQLYAHSGDIAWSAPGGAPTPLPAPGTAMLTAAAPPAAAPLVGEFPRWLTHDDRDLLQKQAADAIEARLRSDKAVSVALREILDDRPPRVENIQLALRCLAQMGEFNNFMPLLRDPTQRYSTWDRYVGMLVEALDFGPTYAAAIRNVLVTQHDAEGDRLYRMLWSFTDEQLAGGASLMLVESLDHPELDFRVIAYWTLCDVTGLNLTYLPQDTDLKRKPNVMKWEAKREAGAIVRKKVQ